MTSSRAPARDLLRSTRIFELVDRQLEVDARSLALARIAIALLLLFDLALRGRDLSAHYTDAGVLPLSAFRLRDWSFVWSLHTLSGTQPFEAILFAVEALAGLCLALGLWTRAATAACLALSLSLHGRNPFLHDGQDDLLRALLFWGLFLPLGRRFSIDARSRFAADRVSGLRALGLAGQLVVLYESSAIGKLQCPWWRHGDGILHALQLGRYETLAGQWLASFPRLLRAATPALVVLELTLPLLLWIPWRRRACRLAAIGLAILLHAGLWVFLRLSILPALCIAAWLPWLPWPELVQPREPTARRHAIVALPFLVLTALYVAGTHLPRPLLPDFARRFVEAIGLQQYWVVFSPKDTQLVSDGWFVAPALLPDGREVDVFSDEPHVVRWERPRLISDTFRDWRWRHFDANLVVEWARGSDQWRTTLLAREATARWLCRDSVARLGFAPTRVSLYFVERWVDRPGDAPRRRLLAQSACSP